MILYNTYIRDSSNSNIIFGKSNILQVSAIFLCHYFDFINNNIINIHVDYSPNDIYARM